MENNLVELKYDKVNEYFEKFKKKYKEDYKNNNVKRTYVGHNYTSLIIGLFMALLFKLIQIQVLFLIYLTNLFIHGFYLLY